MKHLTWKILLLSVAAALVFLWLIKAPLIATYLTGKMKVPVTIGSLNISPSKTKIHNFQINNPRGFKAKAAFKAEEIEVDYQFKQLFGNPSVIDLIDVRDVFLSIELLNATGSRNNWTVLGSKLPKEEPSSHARALLIHKLVLTNLTVEIRGLSLNGAPQFKKIDRLEFNEIDSREGFPTKELIRAIFQGAGLQDYIKELLSPENLLKKFFSPLGENKKAQEELPGPLNDKT